MIKAPWTQEQVDGLNAYQAAPWVHPFTCGNKHGDHGDENVLVATPEGWRCLSCDYTQDWAHASMAKGQPPKPRFGP